MSFSRTILVASAVLLNVALATVNQFINADLVWPKPQARYNISIEGVTYPPPDQLDSYSAFFPCFYVPVPENVERIPWPIRGGRIQIKYTSDRWSSDDEIDNSIMGWWNVQEVFGQFRGLDVGSENVNHAMEYHFLPSYPSANATWKLGTSCLDPMQPLDWVQEDQRLYLKTGLDGMAPKYNVSAAELEGVEATLGVKMAYNVAHNLLPHGGEWMGDVFAECVYVRLTSDPVEGPPCRPEDTDLSPTAVPVPTGGPNDDGVGGGGLPPTDDNGGDDIEGIPAPNHQVSSTTVGIAVGVSSGIAIAIIVLAIWLYRRRRANRALAASALATAESGLGKSEKKPRDVKGVETVEEKEKKDDKKVAVDSDLIMIQEAVAEADRREMVRKGKKVDDGSDDAISETSVYSEPLPKYEEKPKE